MNRFLLLSIVALSLVGRCGARADVQMPLIFGDHMVLQQGATLPVWGTADPGEKVTVTVGSNSGTATADADGKWMVKLTPLPKGTPPVSMTVAGKNTITFTDVLIGDVWLCSGQSNMFWNLKDSVNGRNVIPKANDPQLRLFFVTPTLAIQPLNDLKQRASSDNPSFVSAKWMVCSPDTVSAFSGVGYFFGHELRTTLKCPIGLVEDCVGGTGAQCWTSLSALQSKGAVYQEYLDRYNTVLTDFPAKNATYPAQQAAYEAALAKWKSDVLLPMQQVTLPAWNLAAQKAKAAGEPLPPHPLIPPPPAGVRNPNGDGNTATVLFNGMINPIIPFAFKGVIWYQGEANTPRALLYRELFPLMISDWRARWGLGDFPFLFVQLAAFDDSKAPQNDWALLRESQVKSLSVPNTGMASAVDIGDPTFIHPQDKEDVGLRLALVAKHLVYGQNVVASGPLYDSMKVEGNGIRINFKEIGSGVVIGKAPWIPVSMRKNPVSTTQLEGFSIAAADQTFVPAVATIDGNTVVVSSPAIAQPVAVRYGWADAPRVNLYNKEGLPASPFRTDDWPDAPVAAPAAK